MLLLTSYAGLWMLSLFSKSLSLLSSQAEIKAGVEQVGKLGLHVEPFRYHMPPSFMPSDKRLRRETSPYTDNQNAPPTQPPHHLHCFAYHVSFLPPANSDCCLTIFYSHCFASSVLTFLFLVDTRLPDSVTGRHFHYCTLS